MSGIFIELLHIVDSFTDCIVCLRGTEDNDEIYRSRSGSRERNTELFGLQLNQSFTIHAHTRINNSDYLAVPTFDSEDYLDACGRRVFHAAMVESTKRKPRLDLDILMSMTPIVHGKDLVQMAARHLFLSHVKSQDNVHDLFFPTHNKDEDYETQINNSCKWFDFKRFACLYICQTVCTVKDEYQMHTLLDDERIDDVLQGIYTSPHWKKIGFAIYTLLFQELVKDERTKVPFSAFLEDDRLLWAKRISERVREKHWVYANLIQPVVQGLCTDEEYNRDLNILFIKLHLLDPPSVMFTFDYVRKALPDLNLELVTTNYLGEPLDMNLIKQDILTALRKPTYPTNINPRLSLDQLEVYYGLEVLEFIMEEAKNRGLWTGKYPDNKRMSQLRDRCIVM